MELAQEDADDSWELYFFKRLVEEFCPGCGEYGHMVAICPMQYEGEEPLLLSQEPEGEELQFCKLEREEWEAQPPDFFGGVDKGVKLVLNKCRKCVVVGNGGVLRNKTLGKVIDSFEVIIRLNSGPVRGYESDVGKRTTFRLCYPESIFKDSRDSDPDTTVVIIPFKPHDLRWMTEVLLHKPVNIEGFWTKPATKLIYKPEQLRVLSPLYLDKAAHNFLHFPEKLLPKKIPTHPTSGIIAIAMALNVCEKVYIAGFKYNLSSNNYLHYYGNEKMFAMTRNKYHNITAEQIFLHQLKYSQAIIDLTDE
ncbi:type 2 lactosamine alpha-2,3-sialyltransferase-like [Polyodon spathula]|uniref:type 2 lactosamine alpha-2,3-sialyltransferase-like n=1 Tax=Polyodon spathula TaxID=7913 RepID=UPI001B7D995E|nr:type 2 lactosamine alpha-2,3-sialyltransferase-like [Polyodon spathula]